MRKRLLKFAVLTALAASSTVWATEYRSPWISERGPIRYLFEKSDPDRYSLDVWATGYLKGADKAFMKHGTKAHPLTELYFNKSEFKISDAWKDDGTYYLAENHNPYLYTTKINPRASYTDIGMDLGARWEYPVYKDKGRIGLRGTIPFRQVRVERDNQAEQDATGLQDSVIRGAQRHGARYSAQTLVVPIVDVIEPADMSGIYAYKADLLRQLVTLDGGNKRRFLAKQGDSGVAAFDGLKLGANDFVVAGALGVASPNTSGLSAVITYKPSGQLPIGQIGGIKSAAGAAKGDPAVAINGYIMDDLTNAALPAYCSDLTANGQGLTENVVYVPRTTSYANIADSAWENIWISTVHEAVGSITNGANAGHANSQTFITSVEDALKYYNQDIHEWLWDNGYAFQTNQTTGLGDIDLDLFYEHHFSEKWIGELMFGVRFPTGGSSDYANNPYRAYLGNGNHWELKVGGLVAWQPLSWLNIKLDVYGSFALEGTEKRCAAFTGATVKNVGPAVDANVDWQYFVGRLDFNFFHPKTQHMNMTLGYEFYYKTKDSIKYKQSTMQSWLGDKWNNATYAYEAFPIALDSGVLEANSEAISHKARLEGSWRATQWLEFFAGGTYVFAGQHIPREADCHGGVNVKF